MRSAGFTADVLTGCYFCATFALSSVLSQGTHAAQQNSILLAAAAAAADLQDSVQSLHEAYRTLSSDTVESGAELIYCLMLYVR